MMAFHCDNGRYLFHEYFKGDNGAGRPLAAKLIQQQGEFGTIR